MKPTCLFIGRFQPFHNGHLLVVQGMSRLCGRMVIGIGSPEASGTADNPFSLAERKEMIQRALQGINIIPMLDVSIVEIPDMADDRAWVESVLARCGRVDTLWTGNEWVKRCFEDRGVAIQVIKEVPGVSATEVRARLASGSNWAALLPPEVVAYIDAIDGAKRVKE